MKPAMPPPLPANRRTTPPPAPESAPPSKRALRPGATAEPTAPPASRRKPSAKGAPASAPNPPRRKSGAWLQKLQFVTGLSVVIAASVLVAWGLRSYLHKSPRFAVANIAVEGVQRLSSQRVARAAGVATGNNIFDIDEDSSAARVKSDPWVESVKVRKELPDTLHIQVVERDPRLLAGIAGKLFLVDAKGFVFKEAEPGDPIDFPVVTGLSADELAQDPEAVTRRLRAALELLADLDQERIAERFPIQELHLDEVGNLTVVAGAEGMSLVFGAPPYRAKVTKAVRIFAELRGRQAKADVLFLDNRSHPERVVVRLRNERAVAKADVEPKESP